MASQKGKTNFNLPEKNSQNREYISKSRIVKASENKENESQLSSKIYEKGI